MRARAIKALGLATTLLHRRLSADAHKGFRDFAIVLKVLRINPTPRNPFRGTTA